MLELELDRSSRSAGCAAIPSRPPSLELECCDVEDAEGTGFL